MSIPVNTPAAETVADLVEYWSTVRRDGPLAPATVNAYLGAIGRILQNQGVLATARLDELDLPALTASYENAHPDLQPATLKNAASHLRAAINGYRARNQPVPAAPATSPFTVPDTARPAEPEREQADHDPEFDGTLAHLPAFARHTGRSGQLRAKTADLYAGAVHRILADQPHLAKLRAENADPVAIMKQFGENNPGLKRATLKAYTTRLTSALAAYAAHLTVSGVNGPQPATPEPRPDPEGAGQVVALPGGRSVRLSAPPDLTDEESAAAGAVLRLHHPAMFTSAAPGAVQPASGPGTWTLVFWPEYAPDAPESAHLSGPTFRRALADYIRTRGPAVADLDDRAAIDAWYSTEVFVAHAFDGHHEPVDAGALLRSPGPVSA